MNCAMTKNQLVPVEYIPGSRPLKVAKYERFARYRAQALPRGDAYRKANDNKPITAGSAYQWAWKIEKNRAIADRIAYLTRQAEERTIEKRQRIEEQLWAVHEADIGDYFESYDAPARDHEGKIIEGEQIKRQRPKLLEDITPDRRKLIDELVPDGRGRFVPKLASKHQANKELRAFLNFGKSSDASDVSKLSDAELISQLAQQAKELGVDIKLDYTFHKPSDDDKS